MNHIRIAKQLIKLAKSLTASYIDSNYYYQNTGKELAVCMNYYYPEDVDECIQVLTNMKNQLQNVTTELSKYGVLKKYETFDTDINKIEVSFIFIKNEESDESTAIQYLQKNGFKHDNMHHAPVI